MALSARKAEREPENGEFRGTALRPAVSIYIDFGKEIAEEMARMYRDTRRELEGAFEAGPLHTAMDDGITSQARIRINALMEKWNRRFNRLAKKSVRKMIARTLRNSAVTVNMSLKEVGKGLEIDTTATNERLQQVIHASTEEASMLIKRIPQQFLTEVQGQVMRSITSGQGIKDLVPYLTKKYEGDVRWARHVAMDQTRKAYASMNQSRLQAVGCESYIWVHTGGSRYPRKEHIEMSGTEYRWDDPPVIDKRSGEKGHPGTAPFCLPGSSKVECTHGIHKLFRRSFTGQLSKLVTEHGSILEATPNHPILTASGWKPIQNVEVGEYVVKARAQSVDSLECDVEGGSATFAELFDAAFCLIGSERRSGGLSALEFHGDMSDGEIDVVDIDSLLPDEADASFCQHVLKVILAWADKCFWLSQRFGDSAPAKTVVRALGAPDGIVSGLGALFALFDSHAPHAGDVCIGLASHLNASLQESPSYDGARYAITLGKLKLADASDVGRSNFRIGELLAIVSRAFDLRDDIAPHADRLAKIVGRNADLCGGSFDSAPCLHQFERVVEHRVSEFSSHVYNLHTGKNWYSTNGLIVHNCRCIAKPVFRFPHAS